MKQHPWFWLASAVLALLAPASVVAQPAAYNFVAPQMIGANEVPPHVTPALGAAAFNLSPDGTVLRFQVVVARISNPVASHIHMAPPGVSGPILVGLFAAPPGGGPVNGVLTQGAIVRGVTLTPAAFDALIAAMRTGNTYVNVHTNDGVAPPNTGPGDFPGGEIRAQIIPRP